VEYTKKIGVACAHFRFLTPFIALCSRLLRNSPRPWVRHTRSSASLSSLKHSVQKAKSSISPQPYPIFLYITNILLNIF